jgi:hypothetical protein
MFYNRDLYVSNNSFLLNYACIKTSRTPVRISSADSELIINNGLAISKKQDQSFYKTDSHSYILKIPVFFLP